MLACENPMVSYEYNDHESHHKNLAIGTVILFGKAPHRDHWPSMRSVPSSILKFIANLNQSTSKEEHANSIKLKSTKSPTKHPLIFSKTSIHEHNYIYSNLKTRNDKVENWEESSINENVAKNWSSRNNHHFLCRKALESEIQLDA